MNRAFIILMAAAAFFWGGVFWFAAHSAERKDALDQCEARLRAYFGRCIQRETPQKCNEKANTDLCDGVDGPTRNLIEFRNWRRKPWI